MSSRKPPRRPPPPSVPPVSDYWDSPTFESPTDFTPLLADNEQYSLSELDVSRPVYHYVSAGRSLAALHSLGIRHGDLHKSHVFFDSRTGRTGFIDFGDGSFTDLSPNNMAYDFIAPFISFEREGFYATLVGYAGVSRIILDELYPNYTEELLGILGGVATGLPDQRVDREGARSRMERAGLSLALKGDRLALRRPLAPLPPELWDEDPSGWLVFVSGLMLAGFDCAPLFEGGARPSSELGRHIHRLFSRLHTSEPLDARGAYESDEVAIGVGFIKGLREELGFPAAPDAERFKIPAGLQPDHLASSILLKSLRQAPEAAANSFVDRLAEFSDYVAAACDAEAKDDSSGHFLRHSAGFAQLSLMLAQYNSLDSRHDEARAATLFKRHARLSWVEGLLEGDDLGKTMRDISYVSSRAITCVRLFLNSVQAAEMSTRNALWSLLWRALSLNRASLSWLHRYSPAAGEHAKKWPELVNSIAPGIAGRHAALLQHYFQSLLALQHLGELMQVWTDDKSVMMEEFQWAAGLTRYLRDNPLDSEGRRMLAEGVEKFKDIMPESVNLKFG